MHRSRSAGRRLVAAVAALAVAGGALVSGATTATANPSPPKDPGTARIAAARAEKQALASRVGALSGQIAQAKLRLQQAQDRVNLAEQKVALAISRLEIAQAAAVRARADVHKAQKSVVDARVQFARYLQATYMSGDVQGTTGTLLTATDPNSLLEQSSLAQYEAQHQANAIGTLQRATVAKSNADAAARGAVARTKQLAAQAKAAQESARQAFAAQQAQKVQLQNAMAATQTELDAAQAHLADLNNQRAKYLAYQRYLAWKAEQARKAELARERAARERAARQGHHGGGGSSGGGWSSGPSAPSGGSWSAAKGARAVRRALSQLGMPYIWAGGNAYGPTTGGCTDPIAPCGTLGFDCSGLVMYGWGQNWDHYAATQFTQAGSYHPSPGNFRKGDLLFWSDNGTIGGIGHVAMYIGGGNVVQAPQSGDVVKITPWYAVESGYFGATRPLT